MKGKLAAIGLIGVAAAGACAGTLNLALEPDEYWWGGHIDDGTLMPYSAKAPYKDSLVDKGYGVSCFQPNQCQGLLLSSKGRYVWNNSPFAFAFQDGRLAANGGEAFETGTGETPTLRGAFLAASKKYFHASGKMLDERLFSAPQWNTWIELTYNQNETDLLAYAESILKHGFDPGVLMIDDTWQEDYGTWDFHPGRFPHPKEMCDKLHAMGFKIMVWVCPYVSPDSRIFREEVWKLGAALRDASRPDRPALFSWWNGYSACIDFSAPAGMAWFKAQLARLQHVYGIDGFKLDAGDMHLYAPEKYTAHDPAAVATHVQCKLFGTIGLDYPLNEYRAMWQLAGQPLAERLHDKSHSWKDVRQCVADILAQGLEGYTFNCPDMVGGGNWTSFQPGKPMNFKMIVRSAQVHALMPMMQFSVNPWRIMTKPEDQKYLSAIQKAAALRKAHTPLILQLARESAKTGEPIVRHLAYVFPGEGLEEVRDEFALGNDLIVAPVLDENDSRLVRLPAGEWRGDDGSVVKGPAAVTLTDVALDRLPTYTRVPSKEGDKR